MKPAVLTALRALVSAGIVLALLRSESSGTGAENVGESGPERAPTPEPTPEPGRDREPRRCKATESNPGGTDSYIPDARSRSPSARAS